MKITKRQAALAPAVYLALSVLAGMAGMAVIGGLAAASASASGDDRMLDIGHPGNVQIVPVAPDQAGRISAWAAPLHIR